MPWHRAITVGNGFVGYRVILQRETVDGRKETIARITGDVESPDVAELVRKSVDETLRACGMLVPREQNTLTQYFPDGREETIVIE